MNIKEFRQKYPQYNDMDDNTLANTFYDKYYKDMPKEKFMLQFVGKPNITQNTTSDKTPAWAGKYPNIYGVAGAGYETVGKLLEPLMAAAGGIITAPTGGLAVPAGVGLGYAAGK